MFTVSRKRSHDNDVQSTGSAVTAVYGPPCHVTDGVAGETVPPFVAGAIACAARTAAAASASPAPYCGSVPGTPRSRAVCFRMSRTCWLVRVGFAAHVSAATPLTWGVAIEVPLSLMKSPTALMSVTVGAPSAARAPMPSPTVRLLGGPRL